MKILILVATVSFLDVGLQGGVLLPVAAALAALAILWRLSLAPLPQ